ncbi:DNA topoisomerase 2 [Trifolium repens]|nr:DNA topoisomerase 2 [Trifolium repens]
MRYGKVIIMADRNYVGSHFKGLIMNLFYVLWPGLLKCDDFLYDFVTPILKTSKDSNIHKYFDYIQEYDKWRENDIDSSNYTYPPKYLKWILKFKPDTYLDPRINTVRYFELVEKELVIYAKESLHRSIPSLLDGFKPSQRKIMYTLLKTKILEEINVEELTGVVSRHCGYNHGNIVLCEIIIKMAQGFAGKNNITFLLPSGQFGMRDMDHGGTRYLHTMLNPKSRIFFTRDDEIIPLSMEDGKPRPKWYFFIEYFFSI